jgi:cell division protein FtsA
VVLTGGGSELKGMPITRRACSAAQVRVGRPRLPGLPDAHAGPAFTTLAGLAQFAASKELDLRSLGPIRETRRRSRAATSFRA